MSVKNNIFEKYMTYTEFYRLLSPFTVFSLADIKQADPGFHRRRLNEWQKKGYIHKIIKGYYLFADKNIDEKIIFEIANRIYKPSYVSFEIALAYYGLIPESVYGVTSASTRKTSYFKTYLGSFTYRSIQPKLYFGFNFLKNNNRLFKLASPEKAFLDLFYIKTELRDAAAFETLRINRKVFFNVISRSKIKDYLAVYGQASLRRRIGSFLEYIEYA